MRLTVTCSFQCGADYVKSNQLLPAGFEQLQPGDRCVSLDGDADRIVYFTVDSCKM